MTNQNGKLRELLEWAKKRKHCLFNTEIWIEKIQSLIDTPEPESEKKSQNDKKIDQAIDYILEVLNR